MFNINEYTENTLPVLSEHEALSRYDDMLDDVYEDVSIAGIQYSVSRVLKTVDPIAYRVGFCDYIDSMREEFTVEGC